MSTLSVPLNPEMTKAVEKLVNDGIASNKADAVRKALDMYIEDQAVQAVLNAEKEPSLEGDLDELAEKL